VLHIAPQTLRKRKDRGKLLTVKLSSGDLGYPAFQFESESMLAGIAMVLTAIEVDEPWARLNFMFLKLSELGGERPVDAVRSGNSDVVAVAVKHFGKHGAS
jgi:hypothetical protein